MRGVCLQTHKLLGLDCCRIPGQDDGQPMSDFVKQLRELKALVDDGILTPAEFEEEKGRLMAARRETPVVVPTSLVSDGSVSLSGETVVQGPTGSPPAHGTMGALPDKLGSYRILGVLGAGGMGRVVRARHVREQWATRQGGDVAIKIIHPHIAQDSMFQERFFDEAHLGKSLQHPGLATVHDVIDDGTWLGTVMELVSGDLLSARVRPEGMDTQAALSLLRPLCDALDHLHSKGVVHRDLKPDNIKLQGQTPIILDLGIAKSVTGRKGSGHTQAYTTLGTLTWMAPEQVDATRVGPAADRYALGLIAYQLLSGRLPWPAQANDQMILVSKATGNLEHLSAVMPGLPKRVADGVMKLLAVDPEQRFECCAVFARELEAAALPDWHRQIASDPVFKSHIGQFEALWSGTSTTLDLSGSDVHDLSALQDLEHLTELHLRSTNVSDVRALQGLTRLTTLNLIDTDVSDVSALQGLTRLTTLRLNSTKVTDVSALKGLTSLTELHLNHTAVRNLRVLKALPNLKRLYVYGCKGIENEVRRLQFARPNLEVVKT